MTLPNLKPDVSLPAAFDDRTPTDAALDMAAGQIRGALMAAEAEFDGHMSATLEILCRVNREFLEDVLEAAGDDARESYAQKLRESTVRGSAE